VFDAKVDANVYAHMEDISGLIGHYAHGNEPSHHVAYLYNYAGAPWKTQGRLAPDRRQPVQGCAGRPGRQRRPGPDLGLAGLHRDGLLSGGAGPTNT
jgi:hypothetical protein